MKSPLNTGFIYVYTSRQSEMLAKMFVSASLSRDGNNSIRILIRDLFRIQLLCISHRRQVPDVDSPTPEILLKWDLHEN